jgi:hypothetical protein
MARSSIRTRTRSHWTTAEDEQLVNLIKKFGSRMKSIKQNMPGKSTSCLRTRKDILCERHPSLRRYVAQIRHIWSAKEDAILLRLISEHGTNSWKLIGRKMKKLERSGDQCRTRFPANFY